MSGRHGGRGSVHAGARDNAGTKYVKSWIPCRYGTMRGLQVGKVYVFDNGRRGKLLDKRENSGQRGGLPMIQVEWRD